MSTSGTESIVIAAGGTGGHLFPAEALAAELVARGKSVALITDSRTANFPSHVFSASARFVMNGPTGLSGRSVMKAAYGAYGIAKAIPQARRIIKRLNACAVVGFGGYPSVPPLIAAMSMIGNRPVTVLHEQNGALGRANRLLARGADALALSYASTSKVPRSANAVVLGNPVRPAFLNLLGSNYPSIDGAIRLLVMGGSLGARVFADVVPSAVAALPLALRQRLIVAQQCREEDIDRVRKAYTSAGVPAELMPFFPDVCTRLETSHLVICRAGASTVAELSCIGRPSILVPLPNAIDDHQTANAKALAEAGGAWLMKQNDFQPEALTAQLQTLLDAPDALRSAASAAAALGQPDAAKRLADLVLELVVKNQTTA